MFSQTLLMYLHGRVKLVYTDSRYHCIAYYRYQPDFAKKNYRYGACYEKGKMRYSFILKITELAKILLRSMGCDPSNGFLFIIFCHQPRAPEC